MKKIIRFLTSFLTTCIIIFAVAFFAKVLIDGLIFGQRSVNYNYVYLEILVVVVISILLTLFYQINSITLFIQIVVTFISIILTIYMFGIFSGWFTFDKLLFTIIPLSFNIIGLVAVSLLLLYVRKRQTKNLNKQLESYKEREHHEEN